MTDEETTRIERIVGKLEEAVRALQEDRRYRDTECTRHLAITNALVQTMTVEKGTREGIAAAAKAAVESIAAQAQTARETLAEELKDRQAQKRWTIERVLQSWQIAWAMLVVAVGWLISRGTP